MRQPELLIESMMDPFFRVVYTIRPYHPDQISRLFRPTTVFPRLVMFDFVVTLWKFVVLGTIWKEWSAIYQRDHNRCCGLSGTIVNLVQHVVHSEMFFYFGWNRYVFDLMFLSYVLEAVVHCCNVQHHQHIFTQRIAAHSIFLSFWKILCKSVNQ